MMKVKHSNNRSASNIQIGLFLLSILFLASCSVHKERNISEHYRLYLADSLVAATIVENKDSLAVELFLQGAMYEQQDMPADAIIDYLEAYRYDSSAVILYAIGKNYMRINMLERAEDYLIQAISKDSSLIEALEVLSQVYVRAFKREEAIKATEELIRITDNKKYLYTLGYLYEFSDTRKSIEIYEKLLENQSDNLIANKLTDLYLENGDTVKYLGRLEQSYAKSRDNSDIIQSLYRTHILLGNNNRAIQILDTTDIRLTTTGLEELYQNIGYDLISFAKKESATAIRHFLSKFDSRFYFSWQLASIAGQLSVNIGDTAKGEELMLKAIGLMDTIPDLILSVAEYYSSAGKYQEALNILTKYTNDFSDDIRFSFLAGYQYIFMKNYPAARDMYLSMAESNPSNAVVMTQLGIVYDRMDMADSSDFYYIKSLLLDPEDALTNNNYAYSLALRKIELDKALALSRKSLIFDSTNSSYLDTYGWILYQQGKYPEALDYIKKSIESGEKTAEVYEHLGDIYLKLNDIPNAMLSWEEGLKFEPDNKTLLNRISTQRP